MIQDVLDACKYTILAKRAQRMTKYIQHSPRVCVWYIIRNLVDLQRAESVLRKYYSNGTGGVTEVSWNCPFHFR